MSLDGFSSEIIQIYKAHFRKDQEIAIWMGFSSEIIQIYKTDFRKYQEIAKGNLA